MVTQSRLKEVLVLDEEGVFLNRIDRDKYHKEFACA